MGEKLRGNAGNETELDKGMRMESLNSPETPYFNDGIDYGDPAITIEDKPEKTENPNKVDNSIKS